MSVDAQPAGPVPGSPVVVAIDGTDADRATLAWAAEEADRAGRPLLLSHAAGHLPPQMSYAERHLARQGVRTRSQRLLDDAARWVHRLVPWVPLETTVRLLQPAALLPAVSRDAFTVAQTGEAWRRERAHRHQPVVAALGDPVTDAHVLEFAHEYADRRGLDLMVLEGTGPDVRRRVVERSQVTSLVLMSRPAPAERAWPVALDVLRRSKSPVVLVAPDGRPLS